MLAEERRTRLLELVRQRGFLHRCPSLSSNCRSRNRRFAGLGRARRSRHGAADAGGVFYTGQAPVLPHFEERQPENWAQKQSDRRTSGRTDPDGRHGAARWRDDNIRSGAALGWTSTADRDQLTSVANLFASSPQTDLVLLGGYIYPRTGVSVGPYTNDMLKQLNVRKTILSVAGITERGYFNSNLLLVETERAMMQAADEVIVVADSTKFGKQSLALISSLSEAKYLVADRGLSGDWEDKIRNAGVHVILGNAANHSHNK